MAQWLTAWTALPENLGLVHSTGEGWLTHTDW